MITFAIFIVIWWHMLTNDRLGINVAVMRSDSNFIFQEFCFYKCSTQTNLLAFQGWHSTVTSAKNCVLHMDILIFIKDRFVLFVSEVTFPLHTLCSSFDSCSIRSVIAFWVETNKIYFSLVTNAKYDIICRQMITYTEMLVYADIWWHMLKYGHMLTYYNIYIIIFYNLLPNYFTIVRTPLFLHLSRKSGISWVIWIHYKPLFLRFSPVLLLFRSDDCVKVISGTDAQTIRIYNICLMFIHS